MSREKDKYISGAAYWRKSGYVLIMHGAVAISNVSRETKTSHVGQVCGGYSPGYDQDLTSSFTNEPLINAAITAMIVH